MLKKIKNYFQTEYVKIYDNTKSHNIKNSKKHITLLIISDKFKKKSLLMRHREVYKILSNEIHNQIYAISMYTYTLNEWKKKKKNSMKFIKCKNK